MGCFVRVYEHLSNLLVKPHSPRMPSCFRRTRQAMVAGTVPPNSRLKPSSGLANHSLSVTLSLSQRCRDCEMASRSRDDVYRYYICWRLKLEGETENMGVCTEERKGVAAEVLP